MLILTCLQLVLIASTYTSPRVLIYTPIVAFTTCPTTVEPPVVAKKATLGQKIDGIVAIFVLPLKAVASTLVATIFIILMPAFISNAFVVGLIVFSNVITPDDPAKLSFIAVTL